MQDATFSYTAGKSFLQNEHGSPYLVKSVFAHQQKIIFLMKGNNMP